MGQDYRKEGRLGTVGIVCGDRTHDCVLSAMVVEGESSGTTLSGFGSHFFQ